MNFFLKKVKIKARTHKILIQNFSYLSILQIFSLALPLITYPYLIRILGKEIYGLIVFSQAIIGYLVILVGFGFNITATREISIHRGNKEKLGEIVSSVLIIKGTLFVFSIILLSVSFYFIPQTRGNEVLFYLTLWLCLYDVIFPIWYFQGIEQMKYITYITLLSRLTFVGLIFILIHSPSDYLFIPIINGVGAILAGIISLYIVYIKHKIKFMIPSYIIIKQYLAESIPIFLSNISVQLYLSTNKVIVGTFLGMSEVAYYDLGEKVSNILKIPQSIASQILFPKISKEKKLNFIKKIFKISFIFNLTIFIVIIIFSKEIVVLLGGREMLASTKVLEILAFTLPVIAMSNIFGILLLIPFGFDKIFSKVILTSGIIYIIQVLIIWKYFHFTIVNVSLITVITEIFVTSYMFYYCKKLKLWI